MDETSDADIAAIIGDLDIAEIRQAIGEFWAWWGGFSASAANLLTTGDAEALSSELTARLEAIHPALAWEITGGDAAEHRLIVTPVIGALRGITERLVRAAPPTDGTWEFFPSIPRWEETDKTIVLEGHAFELASVEFTARWDGDRLRFDVAVYHPDFAFVDDETRAMMAWACLNWTLGEDDRERWIGNVSLAAERPLDTIGGVGLAAVVRDIAGQHTDELYRILSNVDHAEQAGEPMVILRVRTPLRRVDFPLFEQHVMVELPYSDRGPGLPKPRTNKKLNELEEALIGAAGDDAVFAASQTGSGVRVIHFYADPERDIVERFTAATAPWGSDRTVLARIDPSWDAVGPLLT